MSRPGSTRAAVGRLCAVVERQGENGGFRASVLDEAGHVLVEVDGYSTVALPGGVAEEARESFRQVME